jgi:uncharacterized protein with PIN domain
MPKSVKKRTAKTVPAEGLPEWVTKTMDETDYKLEIMCGCGDCNTEIVDLTRDEYIALKQHLAKMRGIVIPKAAA